MNSRKVKVADATGPALDWMVTKARGITEIGQPDGVSFEEEWIVMHGFGDFNFCTDPAQAWPIIDEEGISVIKRPRQEGGQWTADNFSDLTRPQHLVFGPTPLIAAMRCYVASKLGDEVEVPDELAA